MSSGRSQRGLRAPGSPAGMPVCPAENRLSKTSIFSIYGRYLDNSSICAYASTVTGYYCLCGLMLLDLIIERLNPNLSISGRAGSILRRYILISPSCTSPDPGRIMPCACFDSKPAMTFIPDTSKRITQFDAPFDFPRFVCEHAGKCHAGDDP